MDCVCTFVHHHPPTTDYYMTTTDRPHTNIKLKLFSILRNNQRVKHSDLADDDDDTLVLLVGSAAAVAARPVIYCKCILCANNRQRASHRSQAGSQPHIVLLVRLFQSTKHV